MTDCPDNGLPTIEWLEHKLSTEPETLPDFYTCVFSDIILLRDKATPETARADAARCLAGLQFTRGFIFWPDGWRKLEPAFKGLQGEHSFSDTWDRYVAPELLLAANELPKDTPLALVNQELRKRVRYAVDQELAPWPLLPVAYSGSLWTDMEAKVDAVPLWLSEGQDPNPEELLLLAEKHSEDEELLTTLRARATPAEQRLLGVLAQVESTADAARMVDISPSTGRVHFRNLIKKARQIV